MSSVQVEDTSSISVVEKNNLISISIFDKKPSITINVSEKGSPGRKGDRGIQGKQGIQGKLGIQGKQGDEGLGFPNGGLENSVLIKKSNDDYDTEWKILSLDDLSNGNSFEIIANNLRSYDIIDTSFDPGIFLSKTYQTPNGNIVVTTNLVDGKPSTKVLSGSGLPSGILTNKTYDFTGRTIPLVSYT